MFSARHQLFEFCDMPWLPRTIRQVGMGFLATVTRATSIYQPTASILTQLLSRSSEKQIVVLGAGVGGGILDVAPVLPPDVSIVLSDLFPDREFKHPNPRISYYPDPVNALNVPGELRGIRVMYTTFHHFSPEVACRILANAAERGTPIAIFEATERSIPGVIVALLIPPLILLFIPFVRPFRWSGLLLTYILPIIPVLGLWDGLVSTFRSYSSYEFGNLVAGLDSFKWDYRILRGPHGLRVTCMTGTPK